MHRTRRRYALHDDTRRVSSTSWTIKATRPAPSAHQTSHSLLRQALLDTLLAAVESRGGGRGVSSVQCRTGAALYALLGEHSIDRRGRCRRCRGPRPLLGRGRRVCRVLVAARFYLHQPDDVLSHLVDSAASPAPAPGGSPQARRPDANHGGAEEPTPRRPRPRRAPPDHQARPPSGGRPLVVTAGAT